MCFYAIFSYPANMTMFLKWEVIKSEIILFLLGFNTLEFSKALLICKIMATVVSNNEIILPSIHFRSAPAPLSNCICLSGRTWNNKDVWAIPLHSVV